MAILLVIPHNLNLLGAPTSLLEHALGSYVDRGWIGVQLFFVLSGFLITGILLDTRGHSDYFGRFFIRRILRIFPLYYATLLVVFVVLPLFHALPASMPRFAGEELSYWLFYVNWYGPFHEGEGSMPHLWSLAVEEQFYLLWPLLVYRRDAGGVVRLCVAIAIAGLVVRGLMLALGSPTEAIYSFLISRMDGLALGGLVAAALRMPASAAWLQTHRRASLAAGATVLLLGAVVTRVYTFSGATTLSVGYSMLAIAFALFIASIACADSVGEVSRLGRVLRWPLLRRIGKHSYAMYLFHVPLHTIAGLPLLAAMWPTQPRGAAVNVAYVVTWTVLTFVAAVAAYWVIEGPFLRLSPNPALLRSANAD